MITRCLAAVTNFFTLALTLFISFRVSAEAGHYENDPQAERCCYPAEKKPYVPKKFPDYGTTDTLSPAGKAARGFWITPTAMYKLGGHGIAKLMKSAHMNAAVLDMKDDFGQLLYPSKLEIAQNKKVRYPIIKDLPELIRILHEEGIYVIGRVVCFKDSRMPYVRPDLSVRSGPGAKRLFSAGAGWLDGYSQEVRDYLVGVAMELEAAGIDEVEFDYVRFPRGRSSTYGVWLHQDERSHADVITQFLEQADRAVRIPLSADTFGLTTLVDGDPRGLGQHIERMAQYLEAISPMMYANGMTSYFPNNTITKDIYNLLHCGLWRARNKAPHLVLRPWLQAYSNNVSFYDKEFIKGQIDAGRRAGVSGVLFWNPTMRNATPFAALRDLGQERLDGLSQNTDQYKAAENTPSGRCQNMGQRLANVHAKSTPNNAEKFDEGG